MADINLHLVVVSVLWMVGGFSMAVAGINAPYDHIYSLVMYAIATTVAPLTVLGAAKEENAAVVGTLVALGMVVVI